MNKNKESTRYWSDLHEKSICKALNGRQNSNSGAGKFTGGDVTLACGLLVEAKTTMSAKESFSIKKEWFVKNRQEAFATRKKDSIISFRFEPEGENFYVIPEKWMKYLVEKLEKEDE